ncbi:MAG TPA: S9 family peptidase [Thermomicrobiales bacterium]|nr:S9 family peptidase [Thermomicrobiales bacterium]
MGQPWSPDHLVYDLKTAADPQLAPDGARILYTLAETDRETKQGSSQLWLCDLDGGNARRLTRTGARNGGGRWSPDGATVAFVSNRAGQGRSGVYVLPVDGAGEARELTTHRQGISDLAWSPDGAALAYSTAFDPDNPDEEPPAEGAAPRVRVTRRIDYKQDGRGYLGDTRTQVFVVDVAGGERRRVTARPVDHYFPQWSPDGRLIAAQVPNRNGMYSQLALIDVASGETRLVGPEGGVVGTWSWSPAGDRIVFTGDTTRSPQQDFFVYDVTTGAIRRLTEDLQSVPVTGMPGMAPAAPPVWLDERRVLFHSVRAGASGLEIIDVETGAVEEVARWEALNIGLSVDAGHRHVAQARATLASAGEIAVYDLASGDTRVAVNPNAALFREHPPARWERLTVPRGEFTIEAWLLKPPDFDPNKKYPLILDVHGGPAGFYGHGFTPLQQCLATNGFVVVYANPRGSTSYGRHFATQVYGDWGGEDYQDLMAVVDAAQERPYVDAARTGIFGYSYGGYMTAWTITQTDRFKAAVCGAPVFDMESKWGTSDIGYVGNARQWGGAPWENRAFYDTRSPSAFAYRVKTPTLLIHGEADQRCPIGQGEQMFMALQHAGVEVEFARYPGGSHSFLRTGPPAHRADFLARALGWYQEHLK